MVTAAMKLKVNNIITLEGEIGRKESYDLGRKVMTNLDSILKSRDITLPTKIYVVKAMVGL